MSTKARSLRYGRLALYALLALIGIAAIGAHSLYVHLHHSLPQTQGTIAVPGLRNSADVLRDQWGVPHIFAENRDDAVFAQGFVHAQDRLWQMEIGRRLARGRLSEILGPAALATDRMMRAYDFAGLSARIYPALPEPVRAVLASYAAGVNAFFAARKGPLPPEFLFAGLNTLEPWTPEDSIIIIKLMALQLCENGYELANAALLKAVSQDVFAALNPELPPLPALTALYDLPAVEKTHTALERPLGGASNNWVVDGRWTKSGKPLLANDPHLGLVIPSTWYLAHLSFDGRNIIGASLAGVPGIILGRNDQIAWAYTNTGSDVQDFYLEKIAPEPAGHYVSPEGARPFILRKETIKIRGQEPLIETYRATAHGPVLPPDLPFLRSHLPKDHVLAINWDVLKDGDQTMAAGLGILEAHGAEDFLRAVEPYLAPQQNMVFADSRGRIGFIAPGHVPLRGPLNDTKGLLPAPGWKPGYDWTGIIPFPELPSRIDPPEGYLVTANNKIVDDAYPHRLGYYWDQGLRARRIEALITARRDHDAASFEAMQRDEVSLEARTLVPKLLASLERARLDDRMAQEAMQRLSRWDGAMAAGRPEPLLFAAFIYEIEQALIANAVGPENYGLVSNWRFDIIRLVLDGSTAQRRFCSKDGNGSGCDALIAGAFTRAIARLSADQGGRIGLWRWGRAHKARMENRPFGALPLIGRLVNRAIESGGGADTINRGLTRFNSARPFANIHGASYRAVYDLGEPGNSSFMISTGQSGNPLSRHYDDLMPLWARGASIPMTTDRALIEAKRPERLTLSPSARP